MGQLAHLFILLVTNTVTLLALAILFLRSIWSLVFNITTIESWEMERHETLVRRARVLGGYLDGPGGIKVRIQKQEFPYDIGIWSNIKQGMGGSINVRQIMRVFHARKTDTIADYQLVLAIRIYC